MDFESPSDTRLAARAVRDGWPMAPEHLQAAINRLKAVVADPNSKPRARAQARRALQAVENPELLPDEPDDMDERVLL